MVEQINIVFDEIGPEIVNWARKYDLEGRLIPQSFELVFTSSHFESDVRVSFGPTSPTDFGYELIYLPKEGEPSFNFNGDPTQKIVGIDWTTNLYYIDELTNSLKEDLMEVVNNDLVV